MTRAHRLLLPLLVGALLAGCAAGARRAPVPPLTGERILVLPREATVDNRPIAADAADLLAAALRETALAVRGRDFLEESRVAGGPVSALRLLERVAHGGWPTAEEGVELVRRHGITTILAVEVNTFDQVWGKYAKFTRVGIGVAAFHVPTGAVRWRVASDAEVEDKRGRAFQYAMERAVADLAQTIEPHTTFSLTDVWRSWRR